MKSMNINYNTELQVAQDLEKLSDTINRAVDHANRTLEEAKKVPELKQMMSEAHLARTSIENASTTLININESIEIANNTLININATIGSNVKEAQEIESHLKEIKYLISKLNSIKGESNRVEILLNQVAPVHSSLQELSDNIDKSVKDANEILVNINSTVSSNIKEAQEIESYIKETKYLISKLNSVKVENDRAEILLNQVASAHSSLQELSNELVFVFTIEKYLRKFAKNYSSKQLFRLLWKDFGIAGIFIYLFICATPKNRMIKSLPWKY